MLKRCLSPLTLVNQVALIVLLSTAIGLAGMAVSGWLVQGVQGSAHAINKAGSLRMQSYRLLAAVPLSEKAVIKIQPEVILILATFTLFMLGRHSD